MEGRKMKTGFDSPMVSFFCPRCFCFEVEEKQKDLGQKNEDQGLIPPMTHFSAPHFFADVSDSTGSQTIAVSSSSYC